MAFTLMCSLLCCPQVRERLRSAQERNVILEDELMLTNQEVGVVTLLSLEDRGGIFCGCISFPVFQER